MKCNLDFISGLNYRHIWGWVQLREKQIFSFPLLLLSILPKVFEYDLFNVWKGGSELKGWIWKDGFPISECTSAKPQTDFPLKLPNAFLHLLKYVTLWVRLKNTCFCWCLWSCVCLSSNSCILRTTKNRNIILGCNHNPKYNCVYSYSTSVLDIVFFRFGKENKKINQ